MVGVLLAPISVCKAAGDANSLDPRYEQAKQETLALAASGGSEIAPSWWPWRRDTDPARPPSVQTYQLPTLAGDELDYHQTPADLVTAPAIDADAVFSRVLACYPEKSKFDIDVNLRAAIRSNRVLDLEEGTTSLGQSYVGVVANMPLYSGRELDREKEREYGRRKDTAKAVADFTRAIAARNQAIRELALYRSLEARSAVRVQQGVVEANEQVGYLEKVAQAQKELLQTEATIMENRLLLAGMCDPRNAERIGGWLKQVSALPPSTHTKGEGKRSIKGKP